MGNNKKEDSVLFVTSTSFVGEGVDLHSEKSSAGISRSLSEVKEDWNKITSQISDMISSTHNQIDEAFGYSMDEIEIKLAFTAKGKLAFIAEAGTEASITVKLKRKD